MQNNQIVKIRMIFDNKNIKYDKENTKRVYIKLNKNTDSDILSYLDSKPNKQGYIKSLIRKDMKPR